MPRWAITDLIEAVERPGAVAEVRADLERTLRQFEDAHGMTTDAMRRAVVLGDLPETEERLAWLMVDNRLRLLNRQHPPEG